MKLNLEELYPLNETHFGSYIYIIEDIELLNVEESYFIIAINKKIDEWYWVFRDKKRARTVLIKDWLKYDEEYMNSLK